MPRSVAFSGKQKKLQLQQKKQAKAQTSNKNQCQLHSSQPVKKSEQKYVKINFVPQGKRQ